MLRAATSLPRDCPGCGKPHRGDSTLAPLAWAAWQRGRELGAFPAEAIAAGPARLALTWFHGGRKGATGGRPWEGELEELLVDLDAYADRVVRKGAGRSFVEARVRCGRRRDQDVIEVTSRTLDADKIPGGTWDQLHQAARQAGLAVLFQRSSSPGAPAWHATVPYAKPLTIEPEEWRRQDAWLVGFCSGLAGLPGVGKGRQPCGLDLRSKNHRAQPVFPYTRREAEAAKPETFTTPGGALDLERFLAATGYAEARTAWLEEESREVPKTARKRTAGPAGDPRAALARLPRSVQRRAQAWAHAHGAVFAGCDDRNAAALAIGGALGRRGIAPGVARDLVEALAVAGGAGDPADRARAAHYSCENALAGRRTCGLRALSGIIGPSGAGLVQELRQLLELLAPDTQPEPEPIRVVGGGSGPRVTSESGQAFQRHALESAGGAWLDRRPPGVGKNHDLGELLVDLAAEPEPQPVLIACNSHRAAEALAAAAQARAAARGRTLPMAIVPKLESRGEGIACAAGKAEEYHEAMLLGWNPVATVCRPCRFWPSTAEKNGDEPCSFHVAREAAWAARFVVAQKPSLSQPGFWSGRGSRFQRVVLDEEASAALVRPYEVSPAELRDFEAVLWLALEWAQADTRQARRADRAEFAARARQIEAVRAFTRTVRGALEDAKPSAGHAVPVVFDLDPGASREATAQRPGFDLERELRSAAGVFLKQRRATARPRNLLPLVQGLAGEVLAGRPVTGIVVAGPHAARARLLVDVPQRPPADRAVLVLDATGDEQLLAADLGRPVQALEGGTGRSARIVQLSDSLWARKRFGLGSGEERPRRSAQVREAARIVAEIARRQRATKIGLVTFKALVEPLSEAIREQLAARPRWSGSTRGRVTIEALCFFACRGSNAFQTADVDLVVIVGTPEVPPSAVAARRLRLGPAGAEELAEPRSWVTIEGEKMFTYASPEMRRAHLSLVAAELAQAVGRGARGDWSPPGGTWVLSSLSLAGHLADPVTRASIDALALDRAAMRRWDEVSAAGELAREDQDRIGRRVLAAVRSGVFLGPEPTEGPHSSPGPGRPNLTPAVVTYLKNKSGSLQVDDYRRGRDRSVRDESYEEVMADRGPITSELEGIRVELRIGQRELARLLGRSVGPVQRWLAGEREAPAEVLARARRLLRRESRHGRRLVMAGG